MKTMEAPKWLGRIGKQRWNEYVDRAKRDGDLMRIIPEKLASYSQAQERLEEAKSLKSPELIQIYTAIVNRFSTQLKA